MALFTLFALMNVLVAFNAHQYLCLTNLYIDRLSIVCFLYTPCFRAYLSYCLVLSYYALRCTFLCLHFVLFKYIRLAFILSRDVLVLTGIKTRVVFPEPPPQYSEWTVGPLSSATCPSLFMQFSGCHQPVQRFYWSENPIDWVGEC